MPISYRKSQLLLHGLARYNPVRIIPPISQRIVRSRPFEFDRPYSLKKFVLSRNNWHNCYFINDGKILFHSSYNPSYSLAPVGSTNCNGFNPAKASFPSRKIPAPMPAPSDAPMLPSLLYNS